MRLSEIHPILYHTRIAQKRLCRGITNWKDRKKFATEIISDPLSFRCKKHQSLLRRKLGDSDPKLQGNKIVT